VEESDWIRRRIEDVCKSVKMKRLDWVDGTKGLSAIIVVMHHLCLTYVGLDFFNDYNYYLPVLRIFVNGNFAVHVFIALSAYLLFIKLRDEQYSSPPPIMS
jgi:peptidoglycan/LPS O-acetylase OafA/YrhL